MVSALFIVLCILDCYRRYFEVDKAQEAGQSHASSDSYTSPAALASAQKLIADRKLSQAATLLEKALDQHGTSKELWICYLKLKSQMVLPAQLPELYQLFTKAVTTSQSYSVILVVSRWDIGWKMCMHHVLYLWVFPQIMSDSVMHVMYLLLYKCCHVNVGGQFVYMLLACLVLCACRL